MYISVYIYRAEIYPTLPYIPLLRAIAVAADELNTQIEVAVNQPTITAATYEELQSKVQHNTIQHSSTPNIYTNLNCQHLSTLCNIICIFMTENSNIPRCITTLLAMSDM